MRQRGKADRVSRRITFLHTVITGSKTSVLCEELASCSDLKQTLEMHKDYPLLQQIKKSLPAPAKQILLSYLPVSSALLTYEELQYILEEACKNDDLDKSIQAASRISKPLALLENLLIITVRYHSINCFPWLWVSKMWPRMSHMELQIKAALIWVLTNEAIECKNLPALVILFMVSMALFDSNSICPSFFDSAPAASLFYTLLDKSLMCALKTNDLFLFERIIAISRNVLKHQGSESTISWSYVPKSHAYILEHRLLDYLKVLYSLYQPIYFWTDAEEITFLKGGWEASLKLALDKLDLTILHPASESGKYMDLYNKKLLLNSFINQNSDNITLQGVKECIEPNLSLIDSDTYISLFESAQRRGNSELIKLLADLLEKIRPLSNGSYEFMQWLYKLGIIATSPSTIENDSGG